MTYIVGQRSALMNQGFSEKCLKAEIKHFFLFSVSELIGHSQQKSHLNRHLLECYNSLICVFSGHIKEPKYQTRCDLVYKLGNCISLKASVLVSFHFSKLTEICLIQIMLFRS